jgi:hypothetical protein
VPLAALALIALAPASSQAFALQEVGGLNSPASGITTSMDGSIWAALPKSHELAWFDATSPTPTAHYVSTGPGKCGPGAIAYGGNGLMYFPMPFDGSCTSELGQVDLDGNGFASTATVAGNSYDVAVINGRLYTPDFDGDVVRRVGLSNLGVVEAVVGTPVGTNPSGIAADGSGRVWVTLYSTGQLAYLPVNAANGCTTHRRRVRRPAAVRHRHRLRKRRHRS